MTNSLDIYNKANAIVLDAATRDPEHIADHLGIKIYYKDNYKNLLGMYAVNKGLRAIFVNNKLEKYMHRMVLAHEIGHDTLHRDIAKKEIMQEFTLFSMKDNTEYEANVFAAHLLLDSEEVFQQAKEGLDIVNLSQINCVNVNLVAIKVCEMIALGYDLRVPIDVNRNFLKDIKI